MTCAKTVIVMNHGEVIQAGSQQDLFDRPATDYVLIGRAGGVDRSFADLVADLQRGLGKLHKNAS